MRVNKTVAAAALVLASWSAAGGVASADPAAPPPPAPAGPKTTIDADGIYKVGTDIAPGTYASAGPANDGTCSWKRISAANETIDNALTHKPQVVSIEPTDATFKTSGCQTWSLTDAAPPASVGNLQAQAAMAMLNGILGGGVGGGGGAASAPAPAAAPAAPALPGATGPLPGPAAEPAS
ncbi:MAG: hypothetical protein QOE20_4700 [Mycobacterium sp.]|jgi:uncharacterized protein YcfJ|nr:hypothetical protein [Mycobacterium sp.]